jgi:GDP-mannose pyrophosphatase NudK
MLGGRLGSMSADAANAGDRIRILEERVLSDDWYTLKKTTFEYRRRNGHWQRQSRETYDRGNGAVLLLYNVERASVVLTRQFRFPAYVNGCADGQLIEACAGLLDGQDPQTCIRREAEEETGFTVRSPRKVFEAYMSPGSVTEKLYFFVAEYEAIDRLSAGGGDFSEGEDIEVIELPMVDALHMMAAGAIQDGKTIMLLQHAAILGLQALREGPVSTANLLKG